MNLEPRRPQEIVAGSSRIRDLAAELAEAFDDARFDAGRRDMRESLDRVLQLLGYPE